ncbi:alpha/beta fold hydrolase [candidate division KSB3 bacterium]|uniref:Alpha/beta fold hydrolase n=1 Tax=candidate division KSB3 bacterium TaxID=2044937 RepID=A0A9D5JWS2_9BACT|nr:alpha/beta fold hydrolase [candidate division KSB3 bacterium]MBD3325658.1 alpha/beta fold hydrolase [candidate division KSB3 bacterium]
MLKILIMIGGVVLVAGIAVVVGVRYLERKMIYFPIPFPEGYWDTSDFPGQLEECTFQTDDGLTLHGWLARTPARGTEQPPTLLFLHGNAGNLTHRRSNVAALLEFGVDVFIFDYRGYGKSEGTPDEQGLYADALAAYEYLLSHDDVDPQRLVVFGRSLGGAVAVELAMRRPCAKLIVESTFTSIKDMTQEMFGGLPIHYLVRTKFDSLSKIGQVDVPLLVIHGSRDTIVPVEHGRRLFAAANQPKWWYEIAGADHNDTYEVGGRTYFERVSEFIHQGGDS